jgi:hypothetical protein
MDKKEPNISNEPNKEVNVTDSWNPNLDWNPNEGLDLTSPDQVPPAQITSAQVPDLERSSTQTTPPRTNSETSKTEKKISTKKQINVNEIFTRVTSKPSNVIIPPKKELISMDEISQIIQKMSDSLGLLEETCLQAIYLLLLKGASNKGTPNGMTIEILDGENNTVLVKKGDLLYFYKLVTGNLYLRRLAVTMQNEISKFAEVNKLDGDLARQIDRSIRTQQDVEKIIPLTHKERAWCSSFNQDNPYIDENQDLKRLSILLTRDLEKKFAKKNNNNSPKAKAPAPPNNQKKQPKNQKEKNNKKEKTGEKNG